jgi:hypothetical protein
VCLYSGISSLELSGVAVRPMLQSISKSDGLSLVGNAILSPRLMDMISRRTRIIGAARRVGICVRRRANASKLTVMMMACALHGSRFMVRGDEHPSKSSIRILVSEKVL